MARIAAGFGVLALTLTLVAGFAQPAAAKFYGCDDQHASRSAYFTRSSHVARSPVTHEFAAQAAQAARSRHGGATYGGSRRFLNDRSRW